MNSPAIAAALGGAAFGGVDDLALGLGEIALEISRRKHFPGESVRAQPLYHFLDFGHQRTAGARGITAVWSNPAGPG